MRVRIYAHIGKPHARQCVVDPQSAISGQLSDSPNDGIRWGSDHTRNDVEVNAQLGTKHRQSIERQPQPNSDFPSAEQHRPRSGKAD